MDNYAAKYEDSSSTPSWRSVASERASERARRTLVCESAGTAGRRGAEYIKLLRISQYGGWPVNSKRLRLRARCEKGSARRIRQVIPPKKLACVCVYVFARVPLYR